CAYHCNAPEIHDIALVGTRQGGKDGYAIWVGGGLSSVPRIGKPLGCFIEVPEAVEVLRGMMDIWRTDLRYRMSRAKARFKFMIMDDGPEKTLERLQEHLGRALTPLEENPRPKGRTEHMGIHAQKQAGLCYIGFPVFPGLMTGEQMIQVAWVLRETGKVQAYDLILRGGLGQGAQIGLPLLRRIPTGQVPDAVERLVGAWLDGRQEGETIQQFFHRHEDAALVAMGAGEVAAAGAEA